MAKPSTSARRLLRTAIDSCTGAQPRENDVAKNELPFLKMYKQNVSRAKAIHILLNGEYIEEALMLLRPLLEDTQRLIQANERRDERIGLSLRLQHDYVGVLRQLVQTGDEMDLKSKSDFEKFEQVSKALQKSKAKHGIKKLPKFADPNDKNSHSRIGRPSDLLGFKTSSIAIHARGVSPSAYFQKRKDGGYQYSHRSVNVYTVSLSYSVSEYLYESTIAIGEPLKWPGLDTVRLCYDSSKRRFETLIEDLER